MGKRVASGLVAASIIAALLATDGSADPAADALTQLTELSRQAEQTTEQIHTAQIDLDEKLLLLETAERKQAVDRAAADAADAGMVKYQSAVDKVVAASYMGGRTGALAAALTASSPQQLIDQLAIQQTVGSEMAAQMTAFRSARVRAATAAEQSRKSASEAKQSSDKSAAVRADLQAKQGELAIQIAAVQGRYDTLTPDQRAVLADPGPQSPPLPASPPVADPSIVAMPGRTADDPAGAASRSFRPRCRGWGRPTHGGNRPRRVRLLRTDQMGVPAERQVVAAL